MNEIVKIHETAVISKTAVIRGSGRLFIDAFVSIDDHVILDTGQGANGEIVLNPRTKIKAGSILRSYGGRMWIGTRTSIGEYCVIASHGGVSIGRECIFGPYVFVNAASHIIEGNEAFRFQGETAIGIIIKDGVWLGARCSVLDGVTIGARSVVGAHSLVLRNLPDDHVSLGQPAEPRRKIERSPHEGVR
jgi:acetyltransferase-like isoleucine patch superfamily enzyme